MAYLGGLHYWWPKMTGRMYPEGWAKLSALIIFLGFNLTFFPQFILGYLGMPRRYHVYPRRVPGAARAVDGGRFGARGRIRDADDLFHLVAALRQGRRRESVGRDGAGMADCVAAAHAQFRRDSGRHRTRPTITARSWGR